MKEANKSVAILDIIEASDGMRFTDIQRALWAMSNLMPFTRELRGYWCTNLIGCGGIYQSRAGLLNFFCVKGDDGLWRRNDTPHNDHPWTVMNANHKPRKRPFPLPAYLG